jgi:hypothetical protein
MIQYASEHQAMTDLVATDHGTRRVIAGSRKTILFALWAIVMRLFHHAR